MSIRTAIESIYSGTVTIKNYQSITDPITHQTSQELVVIKENIPCRLSTVQQVVTDDSTGIPLIDNRTKLFVAPEEDIPAGSVLFVTQNGVTKQYERSGEPAVHSNHQEIMLRLYEDYSK